MWCASGSAPAPHLCALNPLVHPYPKSPNLTPTQVFSEQYDRTGEWLELGQLLRTPDFHGPFQAPSAACVPCMLLRT